MKNAIISHHPVGVITDLPAGEVPDDKYTFCQNVAFQDGAAKPAAPLAQMAGTLLFKPLINQSVRTPAVYYWLYASDEGAGVTDGTTHWDITPAGGLSGTIGQWTSASINNIPLLVEENQAPPWYWDLNTANALQPVPNFPANTTAGFIRTFKSFAIVGNPIGPGGQFENQILWSDAVEPGSVPSTWIAAPDNLAGDNILADTEGAIIDGIQLRDLFLLFKTHSTYAMRLTGGIEVFSFQKLFPTIGILSTNCAVEYRGFAYLFADGDIYMTDGHRIDSIAARKVRNTIFDEMDAANYTAAFATIWREQDEILFCYPTQGNTTCNKAATFNTITGEWGFRDLPGLTHGQNGLVTESGAALSWATLPYATWNDWPGRWNDANVEAISDSLIVSQPSPPQLKTVGRIEDSNAPLYEVLLEKASMDFGDRSSVKIVNELWLYVATLTTQSLDIRLGTQMHEDDPITWGTYKPFNPRTDRKVDVFARGRLISLQIRLITDGNSAGRFHKFDMRYRVAGRY